MYDFAKTFFILDRFINNNIFSIIVLRLRFLLINSILLIDSFLLHLYVYFLKHKKFLLFICIIFSNLALAKEIPIITISSTNVQRLFT